jgi:hypothetical protein
LVAFRSTARKRCPLTAAQKSVVDVKKDFKQRN